MTGAENWSAARNILAVRLDAMGDVLMTGPALRALKAGLPGRRLSLLTSPAGAAAAQLLPDLDEVIVYAAPWMKATPTPSDSSNDHAMIQTLADRRFDGAVVFTVYSQNPLPAALLCYLANIPRRMAYCRENPYHLLTDRVVETEPEHHVRHEVRRQLDLVGEIGCRLRDERMRLALTPEMRRLGRRILAEAGIEPSSRWVLLHPGASAPSRKYPPEMFLEAAQVLVREQDVRFLVTGSPSERDAVDVIAKGLGDSARVWIGGSSLAEFAALVDLAPVVLTNNTGPAHLAAALQTPVVDLYALTNPQHTPWMTPARVLNADVPCKWCYKSVCPEQHNDCLRKVPPSAVADAVSELLADRPERISGSLRTPLPLGETRWG
jgi:lipopolysaccharide heptosyltransferase II